MGKVNFMLKLFFITLLFCTFSTYAGTIVNRVSGMPANPVVPDADINAAVLSKIAKNNALSTLNVSITTNNSIVSLVGTLQSEADAGQLIALAASIPGVNDVDTSQLTIQGGQLSNDTVLTAKVKGAIVRNRVFGDADVNLLPITVRTSNGIVYLSGTVDSTAQMIYIVKIAQMTPGVPRVISELTVRSQTVVMPN